MTARKQHWCTFKFCSRRSSIILGMVTNSACVCVSIPAVAYETHAAVVPIPSHKPWRPWRLYIYIVACVRVGAGVCEKPNGKRQYLRRQEAELPASVSYLVLMMASTKS